MQILLTAFEPFAQEPINSSLEVAREVARQELPGLTLSLLTLPVVRHACLEPVLEAIRREQPAVVVALGQAGGRFQITPERVALNVDDYEITDNAANQPRDERISETAPAAYFCHLPVAQMVARLRERGIPAAISNTAGTFICNHLIFSLLHYLETNHLPIQAGFIHLPYLPEQVINKPEPKPSMSLALMVDGVKLCLLTIREALEAKPARP